MKKFIAYLIVLVVLGTVAYVMFPKAPDLIGIKPTKLPKFSNRLTTLDAEAKFDNQNFFGLTLVGHNIDVIISDKRVGNVAQTETRSIPSREKSLVFL